MPYGADYAHADPEDRELYFAVRQVKRRILFKSPAVDFTRVLFLDPEGRLKADIQSGHPRYPYFYSHHVADRLLQNLHAAATGS